MYGPVCARNLFGTKQPARPRIFAGPRWPKRDERQGDFFSADLDYSRRVDALLGGISLEMPA